MSECLNESMRDQLPLLAHDALEGDAAAQLRAHLKTCASCSAELAVLERAAALFAAATPTVNTAAIMAKLPAARRRYRFPRYALAAAASLVLMFSLSVTVLRPIFFGGVLPSGVVTAVDTAPDAAPATAPATAPTAETVTIVGSTELGDLGVDELTQLLNELDRMDANVAAEPRSLREPITTGSEGL